MEELEQDQVESRVDSLGHEEGERDVHWVEEVTLGQGRHPALVTAVQHLQKVMVEVRGVGSGE